MISNDAQFTLNHHQGSFTNYICTKRGVHEKLSLFNKPYVLPLNIHLFYPGYVIDLPYIKNSIFIHDFPSHVGPYTKDIGKSPPIFVSSGPRVSSFSIVNGGQFQPIFDPSAIGTATSFMNGPYVNCACLVVNQSLSYYKQDNFILL